jgi:energy-coupling factor transporter transmembrane protein EcfT
VDEGIVNGLLLAGRILAFAGIGILFASTTDRTDFVRALNQKIGLPPKYAFGLMAAWGILPNMALEYRKTKAAFRARGAARSPFSPALIIPLLVKSVRWSEALACAMESKGFDENAERTHYRSYPVGAPDILFLTVSVASLITAILVL